jgi:hypothetical protein
VAHDPVAAHRRVRDRRRRWDRRAGRGWLGRDGTGGALAPYPKGVDLAAQGVHRLLESAHPLANGLVGGLRRGRDVLAHLVAQDVQLLVDHVFDLVTDRIRILAHGHRYADEAEGDNCEQNGDPHQPHALAAEQHQESGDRGQPHAGPEQTWQKRQPGPLLLGVRGRHGSRPYSRVTLGGMVSGVVAHQRPPRSLSVYQFAASAESAENTRPMDISPLVSAFLVLSPPASRLEKRPNSMP